MKILTTPIYIVLLALFIVACSDSDEKNVEQIPDKVGSSNTNFRQTTWGMSRDEVKSIESGTPISDNENVLLYEQDYLGIPAQMGYVFKDDKLVKAAYLLRENHDNPDEYIATYEKMKSSLINEFGPPSLDEIKWLNDSEMSDTASGEDVCTGNVIYKSEWVELDTMILILLEGADNKCRQGVVFESKKNFLTENPPEDSTN